jgi:hypothetical protein
VTSGPLSPTWRFREYGELGPLTTGAVEGVQVNPAGQFDTEGAFRELRYAVVEAPGARRVASTLGETEPPPIETLPPLDSGGGGEGGLEFAQIVADGVIVFVTVLPPEYESERVEAEPVHTFEVTLDCTSVDNWFRVGEETVIEEPEASVTVKLDALTVIDWMTALEPEMFRV